MKIKIFRSIANSLCQICCSARIDESLEHLADLPDGVVKIDLLLESCNHTKSGDLMLPIVADIKHWLLDRLEQARISFEVLQDASISLTYKTDRIPTDRSRLLLFELECASHFVVGARIIEGNYKNVLWHKRRTG
jgi:hypothetical protein